MKRVFFLFAMGLALLANNPAAAWGDDGHKIVCYIAYELLPESAKAKLDALREAFEFEGTRYKDYASACTFADLARAQGRKFSKGGDTKYKPWFNRYARFDKWHYINLKRDDPLVDRDDCPKVEGCVLKAIEYHSSVQGSDFERAEALFFLGHWVGDIHQPLHVSFADDWGGNRYTDVYGFYGSGKALHWIWDTGILKKAMEGKGWKAYADPILAKFKANPRRFSDKLIASGATSDKVRTSKFSIELVVAGTPIDWANESYVQTRLPVTKYCRSDGSPFTAGNPCNRVVAPNLTDAYQRNGLVNVKLRLTLAGIRLRSMLMKNLWD
jgi:hypothetical protein